MIIDQLFQIRQKLVNSQKDKKLMNKQKNINKECNPGDKTLL